MARARKADAIQSKMGVMVYGEQFTGKSTLISQFVYFKRPDGKPFRVLYLDPENGSIDDYLPEMFENGVDPANLYIVYTQSLGEVREYIRKVKNNEDLYELDDNGKEIEIKTEDGELTKKVVLDADGEPFRADAIVVDGASILDLTTKQGLIEFSKTRNKVKANKDNLLGDERFVKIEGAGLEFKDYQTINFKGQDLILDLMASNVHYGITAREADEKINKLINGESKSVATGRKIPSGFKGMAYNVKTIIRMFTNEKVNASAVFAKVEKDRTRIHRKNEILEDPTLLDWQEVIDKTAKYKNFQIKNGLQHAVETEQKIYKKEILGDDELDSSSAKNLSSNTNSKSKISDMKKQISNHIKSFSPVQKKELQEKLRKNNLPTRFSTINDIDILNTIWKTIQE